MRYHRTAYIAYVTHKENGCGTLWRSIWIWGYGNGGWAPYVPVAERRRKATKQMDALRKKGVDVQPVTINGRKIATSFWGEAWCEHLESFSDFENRLPRGRTYVRNGSVCHLGVTKGEIEAKVSGSELYTVKVSIKTLPPKKWAAIKQRSSGEIGSLLELLQGKLSDHVMEVVTDQKEGLFPLPGEMSFRCSCPDWASMCKHVAAVLYGIGARLDTKPELLFALRGVNHEELIEADAAQAMAAATSRGKSKRLAAEDLGEVFGIELGTESAVSPSRRRLPRGEQRPRRLPRNQLRRKRSLLSLRRQRKRLARPGRSTGRGRSRQTHGSHTAQAAPAKGKGGKSPQKAKTTKRSR